jgi:hypothetical protein
MAWLFVKLSPGAIGVVIAFLIWRARQAKGGARLRAIDEGRLCVVCDKTELEVKDGHARCALCGNVVVLEKLRAAIVSDGEIANVTKPAKEEHGLLS